MTVRLLPALTLALWLTLPSPAPAFAAQATQYQFGVYYGERRIGTHRYEIVQGETTARVSSQVDLTYKLLFVTVYDYTHRATELWQDGCLIALNSTTDDNGRSYAVEASRDVAGPTMTGVQTERSTPLSGDCPASFAYWDLNRLDRSMLINTQTGKSTPANLVREGIDQRNGEATVRYRLEAEGLGPMHLWYTRDGGRWVGLETRRDGTTLQYRLESTRSWQASPMDLDARADDPGI